MKKILKITGIAIAVLLLLLFLTPFIFKGQIKDLVLKTINENLNAKVAFADIDLSLFRNFPDATLSIQDLSIVNNAPFEGDTLAFGQEVVLEMSVMELFKGSGEPKKVDAISINRTLLNLKLDSLGNANYDIAVKNDAPITDSTKQGSGFQFDVQHYEINDSQVNYIDEKSGLELHVLDLNHEGTGDFSASTSTLETTSNALVSLAFDGTQYLDKNKVALQADFEMDLENMKYTFLENEAVINQLPLKFDGYVQVNEDNNEINISFKTPTSSFKNFLAVIPEEYSKNIENVQTTGDFVVQGNIEGIVDETHIPKLDISIASQNASFKYPNLPKGVEDITILAEVKNESGIAEDTYVDINKLNFRIDQDVFTANGTIRNLTGNMLVNMAVKGSINLANIEQAYPLDLEQDLNGVVSADLTTSFDMNSVEKEQYQNVKSSGTASIRDFRYSSPEIPNEVRMETATITMRPGNIRLENMQAQTGQTDLSISGDIQNLMGYLFTDQKLKGQFKVNSNTFSVNDFMVAETEPETEAGEPAAETENAPVATGKEAVKIPSFLDARLDFAANRVLYDNLVLENTKGTVMIVDETASLNNITSNLFDGSIALNGNVSTKNAVPTFNMDLNLTSIDIAKSFNGLELLQNLAPIVKALQGKLTTDVKLTGNLNEDLTPQLQTIAGNALAQILGAEVNPEQTPLLARLDERLTFIDLGDLNLNNLKTYLTFNDGRVEVKPFDFTVKGIHVTAGGSHGFDMSMDYDLTLDVPAEFLGSSVSGVLSKLSAQELENTTVPLPVNISGTFQNPSVNLNLDQAVNSLTQTIIENQKDNLKEKGKDILTGILTGNRGKTADTTTTGQKTKTDTVTPTERDKVKEAAKEILGGILGGRKKKTDSVEP